MSDDTPTERFTPPAQPTAPNAGAEATVESKGRRSKALIIALSVIGGVLLMGVIVLLTLLFARGTNGSGPMPSNSTSPTPSVTASQTPSATPSASPSTTPPSAPSTPPSPSTPPVSTGPVFDSFSPSNNSSARCPSESGQINVTFTWTSTGANEAAIGVGTNDAFKGSYAMGLPASGAFDIPYQCNVPSQTYTVSIRGTSGQTNKTITLTR